ncbi:hypothetical protein [Streptomyces sp. bgisy084]|uniref:hypothetical protein n=1 Tax=unclassified Streptomyces TaxID=2593676 RepID=UPI003D70A555
MGNPPARATSVLVLTGSAAVALAELTAQPRTSTDMYGYAWDGRVQPPESPPTRTRPPSHS